MDHKLSIKQCLDDNNIDFPILKLINMYHFKQFTELMINNLSLENDISTKNAFESINEFISNLINNLVNELLTYNEIKQLLEKECNMSFIDKYSDNNKVNNSWEKEYIIKSLRLASLLDIDKETKAFRQFLKESQFLFEL